MDPTTGGEFAAIARLAARLPRPPAGEVWIGDDAAVLPGGLLAAADALIDGVHFVVGDTATVADAGWRAVAVNVSDIAAMGGRTTHLLVTVAGPADLDVESLYDGVAEACAAFGCGVAGGDLTNAPVLALSVTALGTTDGRRPVLRSGARPGDAVWVTGPVGRGVASGYSRRPSPRVEEGVAAAEAGATAMIDVSDGFLADLNHILEASGVGVDLALDDVPVVEGVDRDAALSGGDDYELVITAPAGREMPGTAIGTITADASQRPEARGWQHRFR